MVNNISVNPMQENKYKDPLNRNGIVMLSYSNEVGTAISEISPKLGAVLWVPTFMYLGADIYDKYKNDKNNFDPSAKRAVKRVIFQALTSLVALPALIYSSQSIVSLLGKYGKDKIPDNTKEATYMHVKDIISQAHTVALRDKKAFKETVITTLKNKIHTRDVEYRRLNPLEKLFRKIFTNRYTLLKSDPKKILDFAEKNIDDVFEIITNLQNCSFSKVPPDILKKYKNSLPLVREVYQKGDYSHLAIRDALKKYQSSLIFKSKLLRTAVGLTVLFLSAKPVNDLVEKYIMKKYVKPGIDKIDFQKIDGHRIKKAFSIVSNRNFELQ